jgi:hypothetical protein
VFLAADCPNYAAIMFGKARDAEDTHNLAVDAERQHAVFCEFLLAGALTTKALTTHAKRLANRCEPAEAHERFLRLCVDRTLGGLAPYPGMHTDLRRLARAAGQSATQADEALLRQIGTAPALRGASEQFWATYLPALTRLAMTDPVARGTLLICMPGAAHAEAYLDAIQRTGAEQALAAPAGSVLPEAESPDGPAGWLSRLMAQDAWPAARSQRLLAFVERMTPRLVADGVPVAVQRDLDMADCCVASGIPVTLHMTTYGGGSYTIGQRANVLMRWFRDDRPGRRDLEALAADPNHRSMLATESRTMVEWSMAHRDDPEAARAAALRSILAVPALRTAVHHDLERTADRMGQADVHQSDFDLEITLRVASPLICRLGYGVNAAAMARIARFDLVGRVAAKSPAVPVERWKLPMIAGGEAGLADGRITLPTVGVPELFAVAWQRVLDGDAPRFDEPVPVRGS